MQLSFLKRPGFTLTAAVLFSSMLFAADAPKPKKTYPLDTCVVSGEKLGSMGDAIVFQHEGREVRICCADCRKAFDKDPGKYVAQLVEAEKKLKPYPLKTCLVSGEKLDADAVGLAFEGQELKFCCKGCAKDFLKEPKPFLAKLPPPKDR